MNLRKLKFTSVIILCAVSFVVMAASSQTRNKRYNLHGKVLGKNTATNEITVKHDDIPGFMPAMTMSFKIKNQAVVQELQPGDKIAADLVVPSDGSDYWLENVRITDQSGRQAARPTARPHMLAVGEPAPDPPLTNQDGNTVRLSDFKGKALLVTFIYTRCPMPNFCPRLSSQFARVHDALKKTPDDYRKTHLLTISFDPKYDTAPVLRKYGLAYLDNDASGFAHWDFAFTTPGDLRKLADAFGLEYFEEGNQISHTMNIVLISPDGTVARYWATEWTAVELEKALREQAGKATTAPPQNAARSR
ncbi:MAG TPA: SCO family protein [Terriglobales bacterium]|nr:SCO family protein [Terriglobales bacterium]